MFCGTPNCGKQVCLWLFCLLWGLFLLFGCLTGIWCEDVYLVLYFVLFGCCLLDTCCFLKAKEQWILVREKLGRVLGGVEGEELFRMYCMIIESIFNNEKLVCICISVLRGVLWKKKKEKMTWLDDTEHTQVTDPLHPPNQSDQGCDQNVWKCCLCKCK